MTSAAADKRVAELETALAAANETIRRLKFQIDMQPSRGNIYEPTEMPASMPTERQLKQLFTLVTSKYPALRSVTGRSDQEHFDAFCAAFVALQFVRRQPQLDSSHTNGAWCGVLEDFLRSRGRSSSIHTAAFVCAVVACGDIEFSSPDRFETLTALAFGLSYQGAGAHSRAPKDSWRQLLSGSATVREPVHVPSRRQDPNAVGLFQRRGVGL